MCAWEREREREMEREICVSDTEGELWFSHQNSQYPLVTWSITIPETETMTCIQQPYSWPAVCRQTARYSKRVHASYSSTFSNGISFIPDNWSLLTLTCVSDSSPILLSCMSQGFYQSAPLCDPNKSVGVNLTCGKWSFNCISLMFVWASGNFQTGSKLRRKQ